MRFVFNNLFTEKNIDTEIKIAHFVDGQMTLEEPTRITPFHVVLDNPTFSLLGLLLKPCQKLFKFIPIHSVVQLYQVHNTNVTTMFHLYVVPNDLSLTKVRENCRHGVGGGTLSTFAGECIPEQIGVGQENGCA